MNYCNCGRVKTPEGYMIHTDWCIYTMQIELIQCPHCYGWSNNHYESCELFDDDDLEVKDKPLIVNITIQTDKELKKHIKKTGK